MSDEKNQWYSNKEIFEQVNNLKFELQETRQAIKKYNNLYTKLNNVRQDVDEIKAIQKGKSKAGESVRNWSGWIVAILTFIFMIIKFYIGG